MKTMTLSEVITQLEAFKARHGDVPVVLWDQDTSWYYPTEPRCFEAQAMEDGSIRVSVGPEGGYGAATLPDPAKRPL